MNRRLAHLTASLAGLLAAILIDAAAATPAKPGLEVKFFLDPSKALNANGEPNQDVLSTFNTAGPLAITMQFLDGPGLELNKAGWNVRFRTIQGEGKMELTYKRRYAVPSGLDSALKRAERDNFDAGEQDYEPEVEWGYQQQTLTFSNEKKRDSPGPALPLRPQARTLAVNEMPGKLLRAGAEGWAKGVLSSASLYGPVTGKRWKGEREGIDKKISIEVWTLPGACNEGKERIVEISFKEDERDKAEKKREALLELLEQKGWLLSRDVLKTSLILERVRR
jgi:hypothetical protein